MSKYPNTLGRIEAVWDKLGGEDGVQRFLAGTVEVVIKDHIILGNADPFVPSGWEVEKHQKSGDLKLTRDGDDLYLDGKKIEFFLSPNQQCDKVIKGDKLRKELEGKPVLNANVLDYLLAHPDLIPDSWKVDDQGRTRYLLFWGTVYRSPGGRLCVRFLSWDGGGWDWDGYWLDDGCLSDLPAALLAS
ncbi:MAG: hypothetical protein QY304_02705 [Candidatus Paceibacterota bacterium]|nr:MAG: hypothetical protein QY304_02705 [Candidatus Paceibacterota bacterium]